MTHPFLDELQSTFIFGDFQQFHSTSFIGREAADLPDHVSHKLGVFGQALLEGERKTTFTINISRKTARVPEPPLPTTQPFHVLCRALN